MLPNPMEDIARRLVNYEKRLSHLERLEDTGALKLIESQTLLGASATITFASIPGSFKSLEIQIYARSDKAASTHDTVKLNFNNDIGNNYDRITTLIREADSFTLSEEIATGRIIMGSIGAALTPADAFDFLGVTIPNYAGTIGEKVLKAENCNKRDELTTLLVWRSTAGWWRSTAAITEIDLALTGGDNFITGSVVNLYGLS